MEYHLSFVEGNRSWYISYFNLIQIKPELKPELKYKVSLYHNIIKVLKNNCIIGILEDYIILF